MKLLFSYCLLYSISLWYLTKKSDASADKESLYHSDGLDMIANIIMSIPIFGIFFMIAEAWEKVNRWCFMLCIRFIVWQIKRKYKIK